MVEPICPNTGKPMQRGIRPLTLEYKGRRATIEMPGWYAPGSEEGVHSSDDMRVSDRALNLLKAEAESLTLPREIKRIRRKLGLTQAQAGELIGGGPRAFQKYEAGDLVPSRAVSSALILLDRDPNGLEALTARPRANPAAE